MNLINCFAIWLGDSLCRGSIDKNIEASYRRTLKIGTFNLFKSCTNES